MKRSLRDKSHGRVAVRVLTALAICIVVPLLTYAATPSWWSERGVTVATATSDDFAPANQGQLKNIASAAVADMDAKLPSGAGDELHALVSSWSFPSSQTNDFAPVNAGQLKAIAKPFYDRLILGGVADTYPWLSSSSSVDDFAIANIGQVKNLFAFDIPTAPASIGDQLATGPNSASLALQTNGVVWIWGDHFSTGSDYDRNYPKRFSAVTGVSSVSAGDQHVALLRGDGSVWTWGKNDTGQLGDGTNNDRSIPAAVPNLTRVSSLRTGANHNVALLNNGTVATWGDNNYGQLGTGDYVNLLAPTTVPGVDDVQKVAAGAYRSIALKNDGTVWAWGYDQSSGNPTPSMISGLTDVVDIAAGYQHALALKSDGTVWAWGMNGSNQLANGNVWWVLQATPTQVPRLPHVVAVASRWNHTLAIADDGTVWAWGYNASGQLGDGTTSARTAPVQVAGLTDVIAVATEWSCSMAMKSDGTVWAWGDGATGVMPGVDRHVPQQVTLGLLDLNHNGMDDRWEMQYFGNLDQPADADFDGDGISNLQEFLRGTGPTDYYNGVTPVIEMVSGNNQQSDPETFAPDALTVRVLNAAGQLLSNAPVTFTVAQSWGQLAFTSGGELQDYNLTLRTDVNGNASVFYAFPPVAEDTSLITATAGLSNNQAGVTFVETTTNPPPPNPPSNVTAIRNNDGTTTITWQDNSDNEQDFVVERQNPDGSWSVVAWLDPNTTSFTTPD